MHITLRLYRNTYILNHRLFWIVIVLTIGPGLSTAGAFGNKLQVWLKPTNQQATSIPLLQNV